MKVAVLAALLMLLLPGVSLAREKAPPPEPATHPGWSDVAAKGRTALISNLFDPGSAQITWSSGFRWGFAKPLIGRRTHGWIACGTVNAKNRMGGYVGAEGFWILADANGTVTYGMVTATMSSCDTGPSVPVNPELVSISAPVPAFGGGVGVADELSKLAELRDKGVITQAEFETQKAKLLAR